MHVYTYAYIYMNHVYAQGLEFRAQGRMYVCMYICMYHIHVHLHAHVFKFYTCTHVRVWALVHYVYAECLGFRDQGRIRLGL